MITGNFEYHKPATVGEATALLRQANGDGLILAGGHSLIPMMKTRLASPACLVDVTGIDKMKGIAENDAEIVIGSLVTQHEIIESGELGRRCPILRETALQIADPQVRYCGTIGGNAANGDPGNDMPAVLQVLNASYVLAGPDGERRVAARQYYEGAFTTARADDEILTHIAIPAPPGGHGFAYRKQKRKVGDYATAAAAVMLTFEEGKISSASVGLSNLADTPLLAKEAAARLQNTAGESADICDAAKIAYQNCHPAADRRGPSEFRRHLSVIMVMRAVGSALSRARR